MAQCLDFYSRSRSKCGLNSIYLVPIKAYFTLFLSTYDARREMKGSNEIGEFEELCGFITGIQVIKQSMSQLIISIELSIKASKTLIGLSKTCR